MAPIRRQRRHGLHTLFIRYVFNSFAKAYSERLLLRTASGNPFQSPDTESYIDVTVYVVVVIVSYRQAFLAVMYVLGGGVVRCMDVDPVVELPLQTWQCRGRGSVGLNALTLILLSVPNNDLFCNFFLRGDTAQIICPLHI